MSGAAPPCFPRLRWAAVLFLAVYLPAYALAYGLANFLFLCNHAFVDPLLKRSWGAPLVHVGVVAGALVLVVYPLTHLLLLWLCPRRPECSPSPSS